MRHFTRKNIVITVISAIVLASLTVAGFISLAANQTGMVNIVDDTLNVRTGPGKSYYVTDVLYSGDVITILDSQKDTEGNIWYKMTATKNGTVITGFVHSYYVTVLPDSSATDTAFEQEMVNQGFPDSYKPYLRALHKQYPNWKFISLQTNLDYETVITNESKLGENLVPNYSSTKSSWKSMQEGAFDWVKNDWVVLSGSYSVQASSDIIRYFMDPRNFLNADDIFEFEQLTYSSSQTVEGVNAIIKDTFMYNKEIQTGMTYAQAFMQIGKELNVSPYFLANRVRQEQGVNGTSPLISGTYSGYEGYYNYFNISASGSNQTLVIENGLKKAKSEGWDTRYKSLKGGAQVVAANYILKGQDTLYLQKFDVESQYNGLYWHQYMQTLQAPYDEGHTARKAYSSMGLLSSSFTFKIPVYKNMPTAACPQPTKDGNPNYKLSSISVSGYSITPTFHMDTSNYSLIVPNSVSSVSVSAKAYASTTSISGTGTKNLNVGSNTVTITAKAQNGDTRTYTLTITRENAPSTGETHVTSDVLKFNGDTVYGFKVGMNSADALKLMTVTNGSTGFYTKAGDKRNGVLATGDILKVFDSSGQVVKKEYSVIIFGDVTGDGAVNALDLVYVKRHVWGIAKLEGIYKQAGCASHTGSDVGPLDLVYVKRHVWGISEIVQQ
jgi:beta-N-acetylglucosaminidase/uncharacterized protein YgiM (DUF1202 family)